MGRDLNPKYTTWHNSDLQMSELANEPFELRALQQSLSARLPKDENFLKSQKFIQDEIKLFNYRVNKILPVKKFSNLILEITECCNLNCKYCTAYAPLCPDTVKTRDSYPADQVKKDLSHLKTLGFSTREVSIEGGEPFLHSELFKILQIVRETFNQSVLVIQTNGLKLNSLSDEEMQILNQTDCEIIVNNYFEEIDLKPFITRAGQYGVRYKINPCYSAHGYFFRFRLQPPEKVNDSMKTRFWAFTQCEKSHSCITLKNGQIYPCSQACHIKVLNQYLNLDYPETNYDLYAYTAEELAKLLARPCPTCASCATAYFDYIGSNWEKSEKDPLEWITFDPFKN